MKLISVKILGENFRSLTSNKLYVFNVSDREARLSTKCFAGLNGSGKSNMLELLSEIFYYLDYCQLVSGDEEKKLGKGFGFEIDYLLPLSELNREMLYGQPVRGNKWMHVQIKKPLDISIPIEFSIKPRGAENSEFRTVSNLLYLLLPKNIIAYSSGQNELISNPFYKLKYHYFKEVMKLGVHDETSDRMFFIDSANNFNVFLANFLIGNNKKLDVLKNVYQMKNLHSFRITINNQDNNKKNIILNNEGIEIIEKLKACSTCWDLQKVFGSTKLDQLVLDYKIDAKTLAAFDFHFNGSALELFKALYKLDMLNLHLHSKKVHDLINDPPKWLNVSDEVPEIDPNEQIFRIEKILVEKFIDKKNSKTEIIKYKNLSDGEHQFNEVVGSMMLMEESGCLLLFDEPDTHFNPKWRAKLITLLNQMAATKFDLKGKVTEVRDQEVILTTHSPFVISDSFESDVYVFEKIGLETNIYHPSIKTYGASVGMILENIFGRDRTISDLSNTDLEVLKTKTRSIGQLNKAKTDLFDFGESIEKFDVISYLFEKENEIHVKEKAKKRKKR